MAGNRSFINYISDRFYNNFYSYLEKHIEENQDKLDLDIQNVHNVGEIVLTDMEIKMASINDLPGMEIEFDVVIEAEIEVSEGDYHYDDYDLCNQWFLLNCKGNLENSLDDFQIMGIEVYTQRNKIEKPLSDALVPYIKKEELDSVATDFLKRYYPEVLKNPVDLDPMELASKMGLTVEVRDITKDMSIFGQIYFHDSEAELYDSQKDEMIIEEVKAGTIFVDPKAYFLRNLGAVNNTIVHECVHWDKHRKAFELERLYNENLTKIKCKVVGGIKDGEKDATGWMEWQANALAPRIQMPLSSFKTKAFEVIKRFKRELGTSEIIDVIQPAIDELATFFCVSRLAAKIRMIDSGYEEAAGAFLYIDGRYIKPHSFKKGILKRNQTFSIPAEDAAIQSLINSEIREGNYIYVDSHFVFNHPKYVTKNLMGETVLTRYALTHMDECCLIFDLAVQSDSVKERYYTECYLNRDQSSAVVFDITYNEGYQYATPEKQSKLLEEQVLEEYRIYRQLPTDYLTCLEMVKDWRGLTYKELEEKTMLNERTIRGIINGDRNGSIESLVSICLALKLPPKISFHIINNSPYSLNLHNNSHIWYDFALNHLFPKSMNEIRDFLIEKGANPL
ncbi:helix-turn-helix domain-containing protein [Clostridium cochlearium]|uniref:helix-turn-helix domain-containing protein n=1 Tax=Clostridium cochlearium TaxID=1494 RepID=UPI000BBC8E87|nr:helix-turn-helix transcriptional regulator [Clostridium cochlearium]